MISDFTGEFSSVQFNRMHTRVCAERKPYLNDITGVRTLIVRGRYTVIVSKDGKTFHAQDSKKRRT